MSFAEIERLIGGPLPRSARTYQAWWANQFTDGAPVQSYAWMDAGYRVDAFDFDAEWVRFRRAR